ncbi:MAG: hypothetical protein FJ368_04585 [Pelagibacterales bacterium]|nr:hypothetical protein [Pelagibacterales bacterium]
MKKVIAVLALVISSSCAITNPPSGPGVFYTDVKEILYYDPYVNAVSEFVICSNNYGGFISVGNSGLNAIKTKTKIKKIHSIERTYHNVMLIKAESCLIVKGQDF